MPPLIKTFLLLPLCLLPACGGKGDERTDVSFYSPAPESTHLHNWNTHLKDALDICGKLQTNIQIQALPDSINNIDTFTDANKANKLPIVTTVDFLPAIQQTGPR